MKLHHNPIIEIYADSAMRDIDYKLTSLTTCIGLIVLDDVDCYEILNQLSVPCAGIAFVSNVKLPRKRRLAVNLALSRHYSCPCRHFTYAESAHLWLENLVNPFSGVRL